MRKGVSKVRFTQITSPHASVLYALDTSGRVWKHVAAGGGGWSLMLPPEEGTE